MSPASNTRSLLVLSLMLAMLAAGCGADDTAEKPSRQREVATSGEDGPAATGARKLDGTVIDIKVKNGRFEPDVIQANKGVVTLRLHNPTQRPLRIAVREGEQILTESGPASGRQVAEITIPVEADKAYEYYAPGVKGSKLTGELVVD